MEDKIYDVRGEELKVGDIVYLCKYSSFTIHKVLGFTKTNMKLSVEKKISRWNSIYTVDNYLEESINNHRHYKYVNKHWVSRCVIKKYSKSEKELQEEIKKNNENW